MKRHLNLYSQKTGRIGPDDFNSRDNTVPEKPLEEAQSLQDAAPIALHSACCDNWGQFQKYLWSAPVTTRDQKKDSLGIMAHHQLVPSY
jgi:hypothetical protein